MNLNDLSMFIEAVRAGSLSAAARRLGAPLATVSRRVRALETQLQLRLVERGRLGLKTTPAGQRLFEQASPGLELVHDSVRAVRSDTGIAGLLRLSLPPTFEPWWRLMREFRTAHPQVKLDVFTSERRVDLVADGIDVALRIGDVGRANYVGRRLASYRHRLVATPAFLARYRVARVDDVLEVPCAGFRSGPDAALEWRLGETTVRPSPVLLANDYAHLKAAALAGEVLTELPPFLVDERLVRVLPRAPLPEVTVTAVVPERRHTSALVRAYIDFCVARAPELLADASSTEPRRRQTASRPRRAAGHRRGNV